MYRISKPVQAIVLFTLVAIISGCTFGQAAEPTATPIDVNAVMTSAAATAYVQLTEIASQATPTTAPTETPLPTNTLDASQPTNTLVPIIEVTISVSNTPDPNLVQPPVLPGLPSPVPSFTPVQIAAPPTGPICKNAAYVADITIADGTQMKPWEKFNKVWRMQNTGVCAWDEGFSFRGWSGPSPMTRNWHEIKKADQFVPAGSIIDIGIDMYAPGEPGEYIAHWHWFDDTNQPFGGDFTVVIKVVE